MRCPYMGLGALISIEHCIKRQEVVQEMLECGRPLNTFIRCSRIIYLGKTKVRKSGCVLGARIKENPDPVLDKDYRELLWSRQPKPKRYKLNRKPKRYELRVRKKLKLILKRRGEE